MKWIRLKKSTKSFSSVVESTLETVTAVIKFAHVGHMALDSRNVLSKNLEFIIIQILIRYIPIYTRLFTLTFYLLLRYQLNANCCMSVGNGEGTSANLGLATGCRRYTAEQML